MILFKLLLKFKYDEIEDLIRRHSIDRASGEAWRQQLDHYSSIIGENSKVMLAALAQQFESPH